MALLAAACGSSATEQQVVPSGPATTESEVATTSRVPAAASTTTLSTTTPTTTTVVVTSTTAPPPTTVPCPTTRCPSDSLDLAETFLRAVARGENVNARNAREKFTDPEGHRAPAPEILEQLRGPIAELHHLGTDLTISGAEEYTRFCYPPGCGFVGDFHLLCFVVVQRVARPSVLVSLSSALGYDADGTRRPREKSVEEAADALHANLVGAKPLRLRCEPQQRHVMCTVISRRDNREVALTLVLAPNVDVGWAVESWSAE